jgi:hypothetical protein
MLTQQSVGLDNVQGLLPESGAARQQHQAEAVSIGQVRPFHLAVEHNELLAEHGVFGDEVGFTAGHISQGGSDEGSGRWLSPSLDSAAEVFAEIEKVFEHAGMASQYLVDSST